VRPELELARIFEINKPLLRGRCVRGKKGNGRKVKVPVAVEVPGLGPGSAMQGEKPGFFKLILPWLRKMRMPWYFLGTTE
jgi:hypothetical protein